MPDIAVTVRNKIAQTSGSPLIVCGNSDYTVSFDFDGEWSSYEHKTARFVWRDVTTGKLRHYDALFTGTTVSIPAVYDTYQMLIGVYAGNIHTTTPAQVPCKKCITEDEPAHDQPTSDVYAQLLELLQQLEPSGGSEPLSALNVPFYTDIAQDASPEGIATDDAVYGSAPQRGYVACFEVYESGGVEKSRMLNTSAKVANFVAALSEATGLKVYYPSQTIVNMGHIYAAYANGSISVSYDPCVKIARTSSYAKFQVYAHYGATGYIDLPGAYGYGALPESGTSGPCVNYIEVGNYVLLNLTAEIIMPPFGLIFDKATKRFMFMTVNENSQNTLSIVEQLFGDGNISRYPLPVPVSDPNIISAAKLSIPDSNYVYDDIFVPTHIYTPYCSSARVITINNQDYISTGGYPPLLIKVPDTRG